ncbi:hypothetical protein EV700_0426 [Fluviicoccus keumensis]|uniref:Uncharacterized protein n=1 Tax=Fluviicoccus keumensis TaxID=1435465 RepID=A0A4Q7ZBC6_9GAMM|nr:hypothetical protein [Fluviicoccus keumensis]RZU47464.1 hypothetical protein EV700_0426 [Fluviicoccus keumensis]
MTAAGVSREWGTALALVSLMLILDMSALALKSRKATEEPAIQDVFMKDKPQFTPDLGQLLSLVPLTDYVATTPETHGPQYRTADWLKAQGGLAWTLQVMQSEDENVIKEYLAKRPDREQFAYFAQKIDGGIVYVAVFGNFVTRELAMGEAETTDFGLQQGVPAPMKLADYVAQVPILEPAIDAPPPPTYGDVPEVAAPADAAPDTEGASTAPADGTSPAPAPGPVPRPGTFDPFSTAP